MEKLLDSEMGVSPMIGAFMLVGLLVVMFVVVGVFVSVFEVELPQNLPMAKIAAEDAKGGMLEVTPVNYNENWIILSHAMGNPLDISRTKIQIKGYGETKNNTYGQSDAEAEEEESESGNQGQGNQGQGNQGQGNQGQGNQGQGNQGQGNQGQGNQGQGNQGQGNQGQGNQGQGNQGQGNQGQSVRGDILVEYTNLGYAGKLESKPSHTTGPYSEKYHGYGFHNPELSDGFWSAGEQVTLNGEDSINSGDESTVKVFMDGIRKTDNNWRFAKDKQITITVMDASTNQVISTVQITVKPA